MSVSGSNLRQQLAGPLAQLPGSWYHSSGLEKSFLAVGDLSRIPIGLVSHDPMQKVILRLFIILTDVSSPHRSLSNMPEE